MKYFIFISIIFFLISCEVEESKNVYLEPKAPPFFDYVQKNKRYTKDGIDNLKQNLSILLGAEVTNLREIKINLYQSFVGAFEYFYVKISGWYQRLSTGFYCKI